MYCHHCGKFNLDDARRCVSCGENIARPSPAEVHKDAGFWLRFVAYWIDTGVAFVLYMIVAIPLALMLGVAMASQFSSRQLDVIGNLFGSVMWIVVHWLYFTLSESSARQGTFGKWLLGLEVADSSGYSIGFGHANVRYWSKLLSALPLLAGFFLAGITDRKQALHDIIAGTYVVRR